MGGGHRILDLLGQKAIQVRQCRHSWVNGISLLNTPPAAAVSVESLFPKIDNLPIQGYELWLMLLPFLATLENESVFAYLRSVGRQYKIHVKRRKSDDNYSSPPREGWLFDESTGFLGGVLSGRDRLAVSCVFGGEPEPDRRRVNRESHAEFPDYTAHVGANHTSDDTTHY